MSSNTYKNVLLVGAAGDVGKYVLPALLADSIFNVSILSRANSNSKFSSNIKVIKVDYLDLDVLTKALIGQDIVISTTGGESLGNDFGHTLAEAAINAGVKWFIPSEFGADYEDPFAATIPPIASKVDLVNLLKKNQSRIAYTFISTGVLLDWGFDNGFLGFDIPNRTAILYDEGKNRTSGTTLPNVAKAVVAILRHPELTLNKRIFIADTSFSQQEALALFEKYTGTKWTIKQVKIEDTKKQAAESLAKGNFPQAFGSYIMVLVYSGLQANIFDGRTSNNALGVPTLSFDQIVKEAVERNKVAQ
jgi:uncharacterized protein YbjT (DUF2867 family)